jgi:hypothetical protein
MLVTSRAAARDRMSLPPHRAEKRAAGAPALQQAGLIRALQHPPPIDCL